MRDDTGILFLAELFMWFTYRNYLQMEHLDCVKPVLPHHAIKKNKVVDFWEKNKRYFYVNLKHVNGNQDFILIW